MNPLQFKHVLVTGGGQGIGRAIVEDFLRQGCRVAIHYYTSGKSAEETKRHEPPLARAECFQANLEDEAAAQNLVHEAVAFLGGLDILVNNAGDLVRRGALEQIDSDFWRKVINANLTSMMLVTKNALPHLIKGGKSSIENLAYLAGRMGAPRIFGVLNCQRRGAWLDALVGDGTWSARRSGQCRRPGFNPWHALSQYPHVARVGERDHCQNSVGAAPYARRCCPRSDFLGFRI